MAFIVRSTVFFRCCISGNPVVFEHAKTPSQPDQSMVMGIRRFGRVVIVLEPVHTDMPKDIEFEGVEQLVDVHFWFVIDSGVTAVGDIVVSEEYVLLEGF